MLFELLNSLSLTTLFIVLTIAIIVAAELGRIIGARVSDRVADKDASNLATAALGLLALLIAFTYAMASARYDLRRAVVLEEANAIGSTANFALMLPALTARPPRSTSCANTPSSASNSASPPTSRNSPPT